MAYRDDSELPLLIMNAGRLLRQKLERPGRAACLSILHLKIISFISHKGQASMREIADFLGITPPSATVLVKRLVRSRHLLHVPGAADKRTVLISIGPEAKRALARTRKAIVSHLRAALGRLSAREKGQLSFILKKIIANRI